MWKVEKFGKSLKSTKFGIILKNIFYRGKMKILEKYVENSWKIDFVKVWKVKNLKLFRKIFFTALKWRVENSGWNLGNVEKW